MSKRTSFIVSLLLGLSFVITGNLHAQNDLGSEEALKKEANKTFEDEDYGAAIKLYSRLLSANLKDPLYNYRYGVCLLHASSDKDEAAKYLENASKDPSVDKDVFFYYGRALQLNYRFNDAIAAYTKYKSLVSESKANKMQVDHMVETCRNGKKLLRKITDLLVIEKKELSDKDFFLSYDLTDIGGKLLVKPDEFKTPLDKKKKENSIIFLSPDKSEIYFSSYGNSDENGKDIYLIKRLPNGEYSKPQTLGYPINTEYDDDFPFLHPNGKVLYFASKGHNSMGGYDIFKSERNEETGTWQKPVNLDFAINTPDDDFLFVTDKDEKTAYFASRRASEAGKIQVFHINIERKPIDVCIFKGKFIPKSPGQGLGAKITVKDVDINEIEGVFKTNETTGDYVMDLPNGGKFLVTVETLEGDVQSDMLIIPPQYETVPIRQEIAYKADENGKMHVTSFYGENRPDDDNFALALDFIKERSKLDVNSSREVKDKPSTNPAKSDSSQAQDSSMLARNKKANLKNLSNEDLVNIAKKDADDLEREVTETQTAAAKALTIVNEKNQKAQELNKKVEEANAAAAATDDPAQKQIEQGRADALQVQADNAEAEAKTANNFYKTLDAEVTRKKKEADLSREYAKEFAAAVKSKSKDAMAKLEAKKEELDKMSEEKSGAADDVVSSIRKDADAKQKEVDKAREESGRIKEDIEGLNAEINNLNKEAAETKNEQLKASVASQVSDLKEEINTKEKDLQENDVKVGKLQKEAENLNNQADLVRKMNEQIKSGDVVASTEGSVDKDKLDQQINSYKKNDDNRADNSDLARAEARKNNPDNTATSTDKTNTDRKKTPGTDKAETTSDAVYSAAVSDAESKNDPAEKENAKAAAYQNWSDGLGKQIQEKQDELGKTTDKDKQESLNREIAKLTSEQKEKQQLARESQDKAAALKSQNGLADNGRNKVEPGTDTTAKNNAQTGIKTNPGDVAKTELTPEEAFNQRLKQNDSIAKPSGKEQANAQLYKDWTEELNKEIADKKALLDKSKDKEEKASLKSEIAALEKESSEKKKLEKESLANSEKLKKEEEKTTAAIPEQATYAATYTKQLGGTDTLKSKASRDSAKAAVYKDWADALQTDIDNRKENLTKIKNKDKRKVEEDAIAALETDQADKEAESKKLTARAEQEKTSTAGIASADKGSDSAPAELTYTAPAAIAARKTKQDQEEEAKRLKDQSDQVFSEGSKLQGDERAAKLKQANELEKASQEKLMAAGDSEAKANKEESDANEQKLAQYAAQPDASSKPELIKADALRDEAKVYKDKADKLRTAAASETSFYAKQEDQKNAAENERMAITKQEKALEVYSSAYPDLKLNEGALASSGSRNKGEDRMAETDKSAQGEDKANTKEGQSKQNDGVNAVATDKGKTNETTSQGEDKANTKEGQAKQNDGVNAVATDKGKTNETTSQGEDKANTKEGQAKQNDGVNAVASDKGKTNETTSQGEDKANTKEGQAKQSDGVNAVASDKGKTNETTSQGEDKANTKEGQAKQNDGVNAVAGDKGKTNETTSQGEDKANTKEGQTKQNDGVNAVASDKGKANESGTQGADRKSDVEEAKQMAREDSLKASEPYKKYTHLKMEMTIEENEIADDSKKAGDYQHAAESYTSQAQELLANSESMKDTARKVEAVKKAREYNDLASANLAKADSVRKLVAVKNDSLAAKRQRSEEVLATVDPRQKENIIALAGKEQQKETPVASNVTATEPVNAEVKEDFVITAVAAVPKQIPVDRKLPSGLVFKVQVGAFRKPISGDLFKGVNPLTGETTEQGFIRYTAGLFTKFESADKAKNDIRALGFNDAFVVAFLNGKRIPVNDAIAMSKGQKITPPADVNNTNVIATNPVKPNEGGNAVTPTRTEPVVVQGNAPANAIAKASSVQETDGLFYTVQVGVFSSPVTNAKLFGIQPLNTEKMDNGNLRYTSGRYSDVNKALEARNRIKELGVKDAFVVAYYKGKRITVTEAKQLEAGGTAVIKNQPSSEAANPSRNQPADVKPRENPKTAEPKNTEPVNKGTDKSDRQVTPSGVQETPTATESNTTPPGKEAPADFSRFDNHTLVNVPGDTGVVFRVQIGAFKEQVPLEIANKFLLFAKRGIRELKDENGNTVFYAGNLRTYDDAQFLKEEVVAKGISDAFIVAFKDGKKITIAEAKGEK